MLVGAGTGLGHGLALALAGRGATVIITDQAADALLHTARAAPDRIQTLECDLRRPEVAARIGAIWGGEPVSALINLLPLAQPGLMEMALRSSVGLGRGFCAALVAGRGSMVICAPQSEAGHWAGRALEAAIEQITTDMAADLAPGRVRVNAVLAAAGLEAAPLAGVLATLIQQRGINGAVIPLSRARVALPAFMTSAPGQTGGPDTE